MMTLSRSSRYLSVEGPTEAWVLGKTAQLERFFEARKPWYSWVRWTSINLLPLVYSAGAGLLFWMLARGSYKIAVFPALLFVAGLVLFVLTFHERVLQPVRLHFIPRPSRRLTLAVLGFIVMVLTFLVTVVGSVLGIVLE